jgi:2'-5' RNA ligase
VTGLTRRAFFALWPDPALREQLAAASAAARRHASGRPVPAENLHLTLAFLGNLSPEGLECVRRGAGGVKAPPFALAFDRVGWWRRPGILWLAPTAWPPAIEHLVSDLWRAVVPCGLEPETRPFRPHVTLARRCGRARPGPMAPIHWPASDFALIESFAGQSGARYRVIERWPLVET